METIVEFLKDINIGQLVAMGVMFWFFYNRLDAKIEKLDEKFSTKFDKLNEKVEDIDRRLCRIEGGLATQGHCLFHKQDEKMNKAE